MSALASSAYSTLLSRWLHNAGDGRVQALPLRGLIEELLLARFGKAVVLRAAVVLRSPPLCGDPATALQPLQRRIERAVINFQHLLRRLLYVMRDVVAVQRAEEQR